MPKHAPNSCVVQVPYRKLLLDVAVQGWGGSSECQPSRELWAGYRKGGRAAKYWNSSRNKQTLWFSKYI